MLTNKMVEDAIRHLYECACEAKMKRKHHDKAQNNYNILLMALKSSEGILNQQRHLMQEQQNQQIRENLPTDAPFPEKPDTSNVTTMRPRDKNMRRNVE